MQRIQIGRPAGDELHPFTAALDPCQVVRSASADAAEDFRGMTEASRQTRAGRVSGDEARRLLAECEDGGRRFADEL